MTKFMGSTSFLRSLIVLLLAGLSLVISDAILTTGVWNGVLHEIGIAFLVSLIIWTVFELYRAEVNEEEWNRRIDRATKNVFFAVLQKDLPPKLLNAARKLALDVSLVRTDFNVTYTLSDIKYEDNDRHEAEGVLMEAAVSYRLKNVSAERVTFTPVFMLPNPIHEKLKKQVCVKQLEVKNSSGIAQSDIVSAQERFKDALKSEDSRVRFAGDEIGLQPSEEIAVSATYVMAKEAEDAELLETAYPSDGISVTIVDRGNGDRRIFGRSVHPEDLQQQKASGMQIFRIGGYLLPHQGVLIWWKHLRRSAETAKSEVLATPSAPS